MGLERSERCGCAARAFARFPRGAHGSIASLGAVGEAWGAGKSGVGAGGVASLRERGDEAIGLDCWTMRQGLRSEAPRSRVERAMGIEPTSLAWEARVIAIIRRPQRQRLYRGFGGLGSGVSRSLA